MANRPCSSVIAVWLTQASFSVRPRSASAAVTPFLPPDGEIEIDRAIQQRKTFVAKLQ